MPDDCLFCQVPEDEVLAANELAFARWDKYPVSPGHLLIIPKRHYESIFEATADEHAACWELLQQGRRLIEQQHRPDGYNIGVNVGRAGGQSVFHVHMHVIPRYQGDVKNPLGGVRGVIPFKGVYWSKLFRKNLKNKVKKRR